MVLFLIAGTVGEAAPIVIAHRGASGYLPEHTLAGKALAHAQDADFIEQDVVLTKDDVPVVLHDVHLDPVTDVAERYPGRHRADGRSYAIDFTLDELRLLRVTERRDPTSGEQVFPGRFPAGTGTFRIATLAEELDFLAGLDHSTGRRTGVYPEIKQPVWHREQGHDISPIVLDVLRKHGRAGKDAACYVQCFDGDELRRIRHDLGWEGRLIQLVGQRPREEAGGDPLLAAGAFAELARTVDGIGPPLVRVIGPDGTPTGLVTAAHAAGLKVHPYTLRCDDLPPFARSTDDALRALFLDAGIDGIFTDFPDVCIAWLRRHASAEGSAK